MDGGPVEPRSGPDDRDPADRPSASMDPYHAFIACGLYQQGIHGEKPSIPWYAIMGNHEWYALGTLPIVEIFGARRIAPLPMPLLRLGISIPRWLDPEGDVAYGPITPANPGPPAILDFPCYVIPNPDRRYLSIPEMIESFRQTRTQPPGHGFPDTSPSRTWYSVSPLPGLRLIALDTSYRFDPLVGSICSEGFLIRAQLNFLKAELRKAEQKKEVVVVATHHPSHNLDQFGCPDVTGDELRAVLADSPAVVLHLCGHIHRNRVIRRAHYVEIETASIIDCPQEGRWIEIWRSDVDGSILLKYEMFSHLATVDAGSMELDALDDDPLAAMREYAYEMACEDGAAPIARKTARMVKGFDEILDVTPVGDLTGSSAGYCNDDRQGMIRLPAQ